MSLPYVKSTIFSSIISFPFSSVGINSKSKFILFDALLSPIKTNTYDFSLLHSKLNSSVELLVIFELL